MVLVSHIISLLLRDRVPTYLVSEWDAVCTMWDGDAISGPVPTLYADNVELAKKAIVADPAKAHQVYKLRKIISSISLITINNYHVTTV